MCEITSEKNSNSNICILRAIKQRVIIIIFFFTYKEIGDFEKHRLFVEVAFRKKMKNEKEKKVLVFVVILV